jgi:uncharacterized protein
MEAAIVAAICDELVRYLAPERVILFGSYAKGTATVDSDVDVLVVTRLPVPSAQQTVARMLFEDFPVDVDVLFRTEDQFDREKSTPYSLIATLRIHSRTYYEHQSVSVGAQNRHGRLKAGHNTSAASS